MKEYIVGLFNGILIFFIIGAWALNNYAFSIGLCFIMVTSIFLVFNIIPKIKQRRNAKEIEDIINGARNEINKEFKGNEL